MCLSSTPQFTRKFHVWSDTHNKKARLYQQQSKPASYLCIAAINFDDQRYFIWSVDYICRTKSLRLDFTARPNHCRNGSPQSTSHQSPEDLPIPSFIGPVANRRLKLEHNAGIHFIIMIFGESYPRCDFEHEPVAKESLPIFNNKL